MESRNDTANSAPIAFLLGAGVSIPIGIPAMSGIYSDFLKPSKSGITRSERSICELLIKKLGVMPDLEEFLLAANAVGDFGASSLSKFVEGCVSTRSDGRRIQDYRNRLAEKTDVLLSTRTRILQYLSETCFRFNRDRACVIFDNLVRVVADRGCPIFSTNYDFALEHVAIQRQLPIEDNFRQIGERRIWNPEINFQIGNALTLVKLHGSVTWYADDKGEIEKIQHNTNINAVGRSVDQLMIFPTRFKDIYDQHFFALYSHFLSVLSGTELLIVAGHSLRDDYLRAAIIEEFRKGTLNVVVVDPTFPTGLESELRPARIGQSGLVTHIPHKFEDISDDLASIIESSRPLEIPARCAEIVHFIGSRSNKISIKGRIGRLRADENIEFSVAIEAYLTPSNRPAFLRVWLDSEEQWSAGERTSSTFLDDGDMVVGDSLSGMVKKEVPIKIKVPRSTNWSDLGRVTLKVALVRRSVRSPRQADRFGLIATDERQLSYSMGIRRSVI